MKLIFLRENFIEIFCPQGVQIEAKLGFPSFFKSQCIKLFQIIVHEVSVA